MLLKCPFLSVDSIYENRIEKKRGFPKSSLDVCRTISGLSYYMGLIQ